MFYLYIYNNAWTKIAQTESVTVSSVTRKINGIWSCTFTIDLTNEILKSNVFEKSNIFDLFVVEWKTEKRLIKWLVKRKDITQNIATIQIEDLTYITRRRYLRADKTYTSQTYQAILEDLFSYINWISDTWLTISCDISDTTSITFKRWISLYKILKDLSENWYEFRIENNVIVFKIICWIDRTLNDANYLQYIYDFIEPYWRNIDNIKLSDTLDDYANGVVDKSGADADNTGELLFEDYTYEDIDKTTYIAEHKAFIWDYELNIKGEDFFETDIGDKVSVYIYTWNELLFYDGSMKVVEKTLNISEMFNISIKLSKNKVNIKDFFEQFDDLKIKVWKLET